MFYSGDFNVKSSMCVLLGLTVISQWHFILNIIYEMSTILDIAVFRVWQSYRAGRVPAGTSAVSKRNNSDIL